MRIVILGAGFAGLGVARELVRRGLHKTHELVLVDKEMIFAYTPWLYQVATGGAHRSVYPTEQFCFTRHVRLVKEEFCDYDTLSKRVIFASGGMMAYDVLVIALGAQSRIFSIPGLHDHAYTLRRPEDAQRVHQRFLTLRHEAQRSSVAREVVIVGAGANGVELCAEAAYRFGEEGKMHFTLIDGAQEPVAMFPASVRRVTRERLQRLGVRLRLGERFEEAGEDFIRCGGVRTPCHMLIFLGGVVAAHVVRVFGFPLTPTGRIMITPTFEVPVVTGVFALGDCAALHDEGTGFPDPQSAQVAHAQAGVVARNVELFLAGRPLRSFPARRLWQTLLVVGGTFGVGKIFGFTIWGFPAFALRILVDKKFFWRIR